MGTGGWCRELCSAARWKPAWRRCRSGSSARGQHCPLLPSGLSGLKGFSRTSDSSFTGTPGEMFSVHLSTCLPSTKLHSVPPLVMAQHLSCVYNNKQQSTTQANDRQEMGGLFFPNVYSIHASLYNWEKLSLRKNYWKIYQTEEKRLSGHPHFRRVPVISQSPDRERPDGRAAQARWSRWRPPHLVRPPAGGQEACPKVRLPR